MNTTENNKKIAEFLGIEAFKDLLASLNNGNININIDIYEQAKFHSDWNWLMKVVERINILDDYAYTVVIKSMDVEIYNNISGKTVFESDCKWQCDELLKSLYEAVVTFIDWYNENSAKEK